MLQPASACSCSWWICLLTVAACVEKGGAAAPIGAGPGSSGPHDTTATASGSTAPPGGVEPTGDGGTTTGDGGSTGDGTTTGDGGSTGVAGTTGTSGGETTAAASTGGDAAGPPSFEIDIEPLFDDRCYCHKGKDAEFLDLSIGEAYGNIVGVQSRGLTSMNLVEPGSSQMSYLWHKVTGTQDAVGGKGKRMPPNKSLDVQEMELLKAWIDGGAQP